MFDWKKIDEKKARLDSLRPIPPEILRNLKEKLSLDWTYHSNAIEGNTLTLLETKVVLEGITVGGKSVREHLEAINHNKAIIFLYQVIKDNETLTEQQIKNIHSLVLKKIDDNNAGVYRQKRVIITGATHNPPKPELLNEKMKHLIKLYHNEWQALHPAERASLLHIEFVKIHPFIDGNGRTARLLQNFELMKAGFPPIVFKKEDRFEYYKALNTACTTGDNAKFFKMVSNYLEESLDLYLYMMGPKQKIKQNEKTQKIIRPSFREDESSQVPALILLQNIGWTYLTPEEALNYRKNKIENVLLEDILETQLRKINQTTKIKEENIHDAILELKKIPLEGLIPTNEKIFDLLTLGKSYTQSVNKRSYNLKYIDWDNPNNNTYHVTDEYNVKPIDSDVNSRRPDIILFVNGIPLVIIECKRSGISDPIREAILQHKRNQKNNEIPNLFIFSQILIAVCPSNINLDKDRCKYATTGTETDFWYPWEEKTNYKNKLETLINTPLSEEKKEKLFAENYNHLKNYFEQQSQQQRQITNQDILLHGLCRPERLLEFISKFTLYDAGKKKIARYQQYFSVKETLKRITENDQKRQSGVIWHTQGSGKSLSMVMLAKAIVMDTNIKDPKIILVTDRVNLDTQIYETFKHCQVSLEKATTGESLIKLLQSHKATVIATTIFKFDTVAKHRGMISDSKDIFILVDEAHRTQYGLSNAKIHKVFPNACFIAYTGTPLTRKHKHTMDKFGETIGNPYTSRDALNDKAIVPLLYEGRLVKQNINKIAMDKIFERMTKDLSLEKKAKLKQKYSRKDKLAETNQRIFLIASDISVHFSEYWKGKGFKGQLATRSISCALKYKKYFDEIGEISTAVIISKQDDPGNEHNKALEQHNLKIKEDFVNYQKYEKEMIDKFNSKEEPDILIVVYKLLTGFDVPRNTVLYIDRSFNEYHELLQATARVNRIFPNKDFGYVIDYHGNLKTFMDAIMHYDDLATKERDYGESEKDEILNSIFDIKKEIAKLLQYYNELTSLFRSIKNKKDQSLYEDLLFKKEKREDFYKKFAKFGNCLHLSLSSSDFVQETSDSKVKIYKEDLKFYRKLKIHIQQVFAEGVYDRDYEPKIEMLLNTYVQSEEVKTVVPIVDIYNSKFKTQLDNVKRDKSKALMILNRTEKYISDNMEKDRVFYERLSKLIKDTLKEYQAGRIDEAKFLQLAFKIKDEALTRTDENVPTSLQGNDEAKAYFGILREKLQNNPEIDIDKLAGMSTQILEIVENYKIVDWHKSLDTQNKIKNEIEDYIDKQANNSLDYESIDQIMDEIIRTAKSYT